MSNATREAPENGGVDGEALRRRKTSQANIAEDVAAPLPSITRRGSSFRRASSFRTDSSGPGGSRFSMPSANDSIFSPRPTDEREEEHEPSLWHSTPLLFAILPAIGGVVSKSGSVFLTDLTLLALAALYLNWCLVTPWVWYHSAQSIKIADFPAEEASLGVVDDALGEGLNEGESETRETGAHETRREGQNRPTPPGAPTSNDALKELRLHEVTALALCFLGPLLGSYILHVIRSQLSTLGDQLISNLHLTLFVLGAEIRPLRYAMKMAQARTIYLQRVVREDPHGGPSSGNDDAAEVQDLSNRINELEASFADKLANYDLNSNKSTLDEETVKKAQSSLQTQIDALNRAVRRYEKRATAQTMQTESRLQDLDQRLKEAVSLAAAAANYSQRPGIVSLAMSSARTAVALPLVAAWSAITYPFNALRGVVLKVALRLGLVTAAPSRRPQAQTKGAESSSSSRRSRKPVSKEG